MKISWWEKLILWLILIWIYTQAIFLLQKKFEAVHAVKYLYNCFYNKNRRIIGQTPQDVSYDAYESYEVFDWFLCHPFLKYITFYIPWIHFVKQFRYLAQGVW